MAEDDMVGDVTISSNQTFTLVGLVEGARQMVPLAISIFVYGLTFGVLAQKAGLSLLESFLMSAMVFAGSSQFAVLGLWVAPLPVAAIVLTTLVVNLRHLLMGAAIRPRIEGLRRWQRYISLFLMNDESWALTMGYFARGGRNVSFLPGSGLVAFVAWTSATVVGQTLGGILDRPEEWGLDFAFTAVFLGLLVGFWKGRRDIGPWVVAGVVAVVAALYLPGKWYILLGGLAGSLAGGLRDDG